MPMMSCCKMAVLFMVLFMCAALAAGRCLAQDAGPGRTFRDCPSCPEMIVIPAGNFLMGSSDADTRRDMAEVAPAPTGFNVDKLLGFTDAQRATKTMTREHPQHRVTISDNFALGEHLVTTGEFAAFVQETGYRTASCNVLIGNRMAHAIGPAWQHPGFTVTAQDPIVCVNWADANAYIAWLNRKTKTIGGSYYLPTEAEWEYAARAGTLTARYWGNAIGVGNANCGGCIDRTIPPPTIVNGVPVYPKCCGGPEQRTTTVGIYPANPFGLYDMLGNVWEWTEDCWHADYNGAPTDGSAWDLGDCSERVARGSDWNGTATWPVRSAVRTAFDITSATNFIGFRVAKTLP